MPRRGDWRAWEPVRAGFQRTLTSPADPAVLAAGIASEHRQSADYVPAPVTLAVAATDVADAPASNIPHRGMSGRLSKLSGDTLCIADRTNRPSLSSERSKVSDDFLGQPSEYT